MRCNAALAVFIGVFLCTHAAMAVRVCGTVIGPGTLAVYSGTNQVAQYSCSDGYFFVNLGLGYNKCACADFGEPGPVTGQVCSNGQASTSPSCLHCQYDEYVSGGRCASCPTGSVAINGTGTHINTTCNWCEHSYYWNGNVCVKCPSGSSGSSYGFTTDVHQNTMCDYCNVGLYWDGSACRTCPNQGAVGMTPYPTIKRPAITDCYIPANTTVVDSAGNYYQFSTNCNYTK